MVVLYKRRTCILTYLAAAPPIAKCCNNTGRSSHVVQIAGLNGARSVVLRICLFRANAVPLGTGLSSSGTFTFVMFPPVLDGIRVVMMVHHFQKPPSLRKPPRPPIPVSGRHTAPAECDLYVGGGAGLETRLRILS